MKLAKKALVTMPAFLLIAMVQSCSTSPKLSNLGLGFYKTNLEFVTFSLDQDFSPEVTSYTVTVDASRTDTIVLLPQAEGDQSSDIIRINGMDVQSCDEFKVDLVMGENPILVEVQSGKGKATSYELLVNQVDQSEVYISEEIMDGIWRIYDFGGFPGNENMYLVEGEDRALLFDTGMGDGDLAGYLRNLTDLPIDVAITHGHGDHYRQVDQFKESTVYIHEADLNRIPAEMITPKFMTVKGGDVIDIGAGRSFEVLELPGHSPGCVVYLDKNTKVAAIGDGAGSGDRVHIYGIPFDDLNIYADALRNIEAELEDLDGVTLPIDTVDNGARDIGYRAFHAILNDIPVHREPDGVIRACPEIVRRGSVRERR